MKIIRLSIIVLITILFNSINLQAQYNPEIGVRVGSNFSKVSGVNSKYKFGINADAFVLLNLSEKFKMQTEVGYAGIGFTNKNNNHSVRLHYINFAPAIGKVYITEKFNLEAGAKLGYLLSSNGISKELLKKFDFGLTAGLGYLISDTFEINARYNLGLGNISNVDGITVKNRGFQIGMGIRF